jgi:hypothetical protein
MSYEDVLEVFGYSAVDHSHAWKEVAGKDAYCPICGLWKSQIETVRSGATGVQEDRQP